MKLVLIPLRRSAAFKVRNIAPLVRDDQRAFKLPCIFRIDAEISGKLHWATHALRNVDKGPIGKNRAVQCRKIIVMLRHHLAQPFLHRSEEHTSELQSLMRISYAVFCLKKKTNTKTHQ